MLCLTTQLVWNPVDHRSTTPLRSPQIAPGSSRDPRSIPKGPSCKWSFSEVSCFHDPSLTLKGTWPCKRRPLVCPGNPFTRLAQTRAIAELSNTTWNKLRAEPWSCPCSQWWTVPVRDKTILHYSALHMARHQKGRISLPMPPRYVADATFLNLLLRHWGTTLGRAVRVFRVPGYVAGM